MDKEDEMTCLIKGCNFVLRNIPHEAFVYAKHADSEFRFQTTNPDIFPYLLVNIGSGVSIVKVKNDESRICLWCVELGLEAKLKHISFIIKV